MHELGAVLGQVPTQRRRGIARPDVPHGARAAVPASRAAPSHNVHRCAVVSEHSHLTALRPYI